MAETRSLRVRIVDENGNSASNIEVSVYSGLTAAEGEPEWYTGWTVDNTGVMTIEELPVLSLDITLENRSIRPRTLKADSKTILIPPRRYGPCRRSEDRSRRA